MNRRDFDKYLSIMFWGENLMEGTLLSVDWDYFISMDRQCSGSYMEGIQNAVNLWYRRYFQFREQGVNLQDLYSLSPEVNTFWKRVKEYFQIGGDTKIYVSDSHALSYEIAVENNCSSVYLFDAHADLGYGGTSSLEFELNCANWLGKLRMDKLISEANIIYSPYTMEKPEYFKQREGTGDVQFTSFECLKKDINVSAIHICRSGSWTPPWFDGDFFRFITSLELPYKIVDCLPRKWDTENLTLSDKIYYLMS